MDIALWIAQGLLAFAFFMAGIMKLTKSKDGLLENERMAWAGDFSDAQLKAIGAVEVAGAIGLILPMLLSILPILTPLAAVGLVLTMIGAMLTHFRRNEYEALAPNVVLLSIALFIAVGRFAIVPVA